MCHDSSVLRYQCWRDYMNEDSGVMIVRVYAIYWEIIQKYIRTIMVRMYF